MQNVLSRCSAHLSFVHNGQANILLPLVNVEVEVHTGKTETSTETLGFVGTPRGITALIETLAETLASFEAVSKSQPVITSEEEWIARMAEMQAQADSINGRCTDQGPGLPEFVDSPLRVVDLTAIAEGIDISGRTFPASREAEAMDSPTGEDTLSEAEVMDSLLNPNVVEFKPGN